MRVGGEQMTKVLSPVPNTESCATWPGSKRKAAILAGSCSTTRKVLTSGVSSKVSIMVASSGM